MATKIWRPKTIKKGAQKAPILTGASGARMEWRLWPALGGIFPAGGPGRLVDSLSRYGRGNADRLLGICSGQRWFRGLGDRFFLFRKQRGRYTESLNLFFQPGQFQFFLAQNFIHILHLFVTFVVRAVMRRV